MSDIQPKSVLLVTDSRGNSLDYRIPHICKHWNINAKVETLILSGMNLNKAPDKILDYLDGRIVDMIILMVGVNNLTHKHLNGHISPRFTEIGNLVDVMTDHLTFAKKELYKASPNVVIAHITGLSIIEYNRYIDPHYEGYPYPFQQFVINEGVIYLNQVITLMNTDAGLVSPWIQDTVHCLLRGQRINKYKRFYDGLHPTPKTQDIWAKLIARSIKTNLELI